MKIKGYGCTFEILTALLPHSYGLVREGCGYPYTEILGAGRGWARRAPPGSSFPPDMGWRQMLSLEACLQLLFLEKMPIKKMLCTFLLR